MTEFPSLDELSSEY